MGKNTLELIEPKKKASRSKLPAVRKSSASPVSIENSRKDISFSADSITIIVTKALDTVNCISRCIADVSIEKQHTKQIQAKADAAIEMARETTKQVSVQEKEATKRVIAESAAEIKKAEIDLKKVQAELNMQTKNSQLEHHQIMKSLNIVEKTVDGLCKQSNQLFDCILNCCDPEEMKNYMTQQNSVNSQISEIIQQLLSVKGEG